MFNNKVLELIERTGLDKDNILTYLLAIDNGLNPSCFTKELTDVLLQFKLLNKNYDTGAYELNLPLFGNTIEWIDEYRLLFKGLKRGSMGDRDGVIKNFKRFFKTHNYTKDEIMEATKDFIDQSDPKYVPQAHYFIYKNGSSFLASLLEEKDQATTEEEFF